MDNTISITQQLSSIKVSLIIQHSLLLVCIVLLTACGGEGSCDNLQPGTYQCQLEHDSLMRNYTVHVPKSYSGMQSVPLVFDIHGFIEHPYLQILWSGFLQKSEEKNFIVVWPQGSGAPFYYNAGSCCDLFGREADDVGFFRALVAQLKSSANIDEDKVFATGLSNGGAMSLHLGCEATDLFAAIAPLGYILGEDHNCQPSKPLPVINFMTPTDQLVNIRGGAVGPVSFIDEKFPHLLTLLPPNLQIRTLSMEDSQQVWRDNNGCSTTKTEVYRKGKSYCITYGECTSGAPVTSCVLDGKGQFLGGHINYINNDHVPVADIIWDFFSRVK